MTFIISLFCGILDGHGQSFHLTTVAVTFIPTISEVFYLFDSNHQLSLGFLLLTANVSGILRLTIQGRPQLLYNLLVIAEAVSGLMELGTTKVSGPARKVQGERRARTCLSRQSIFAIMRSCKAVAGGSGGGESIGITILFALGHLISD